MMKIIMSVVLIICGIILVMNSFIPSMPRVAVIAATGVGTPICIYTLWSLIKNS